MDMLVNQPIVDLLSLYVFDPNDKHMQSVMLVCLSVTLSGMAKVVSLDIMHALPTVFSHTSYAYSQY